MLTSNICKHIYTHIQSLYYFQTRDTIIHATLQLALVTLPCHEHYLDQKIEIEHILFNAAKYLMLHIHYHLTKYFAITKYSGFFLFCTFSFILSLFFFLSLQVKIKLLQIFLYIGPYILMSLFQKDRFPKVRLLSLKAHVLLNVIDISRSFPQKVVIIYTSISNK